MSSDVLGLLVSFQPDDPDLKSKREYDVQARRFIDDIVRKISPQAYLRGADTPQDLLEVSLLSYQNGIFLMQSRFSIQL